MGRIIMLSVLLAISIPVSSFGQVLEKDFVRTGVHESLVDSWRVSNGVTTTQQFSGLVEVTVSGFGINVPGSGFLEDAFHGFVAAAPDVPAGVVPLVGLHISFTGCSLSFECGAPRIESMVVYVNGVGFVSPPDDTVEELRATFPYSPQHVYWFVIDIGADPQTLTLGHGDGGVSDNEGFFAIQLFEVDRRGKGKRK
jgi:hypothetical protein